MTPARPEPAAARAETTGTRRTLELVALLVDVPAYARQRRTALVGAVTAAEERGLTCRAVAGTSVGVATHGEEQHPEPTAPLIHLTKQRRTACRGTSVDLIHPYPVVSAACRGTTEETVTIYRDASPAACNPRRKSHGHMG